MTSDRWGRVKSVFAAAMEVEPAARAAFLEKHCPDDAEVRSEVQRLLDANDSPTDKYPPASPASAAETSGAPRAPQDALPQPRRVERSPFLRASDRIGSYRVLKVVGEGGMGIVYLAEQEKPRRTVALKMIRPGVATPAMLRRFEHEAQVLGRLQHPGIAQIFEAGTANLGSGPQPYFAMEFIRGKPLVEYAQEKSLSTRERLDLFARICDAVQHAHQKGVIHRDLKPGNILVDETGQPKILDFGVARAIDADIQATTIQTDIGQLVGTLPYMSPEQAAGRVEDLDTRSDVYSLGVVLYEVLSGRPPYLLKDKMIHEAVRVIQEEEPTRLSSISRVFRGDIETIAGKALEKERARRYQSAGDLGSDVRRYLSDEPIVARPPSVGYQLGKFARRHRALVGGVAAVFGVLVLGIIGTSLGMVRANEQRTRAQEARAAEKTRADELSQVSDFQASMLRQVDAIEAGWRLTEDVKRQFAETLAREQVPEVERAAQIDAFAAHWLRVNATDAARGLIDTAILRPASVAVSAQFKDQPLVDARLRQVLASRYFDFGLFASALPLQTSALDTRRRILGDDHPDTLTSLSSMGVLLRSMGKLEEAEAYLRTALDGRRWKLGQEHRLTLDSINDMAGLLQALGKFEAAEPLYLEALEKRERVLGSGDRDTIISLHNLGTFLSARGEFERAETCCRTALGRSRVALGEDDRTTLRCVNSVGLVLEARGNRAEAEPLYRESLDKTRRLMGDEHPDTLVAINNMALLLANMGKSAEAERYYREALEKRRRVSGNDHPHTVGVLINLGASLVSQGKQGEAEQYFAEALETNRRARGPEHPDTLAAIHSMAFLLNAQGRFVEAERYAQEAADGRRRILGGDHPDTLASIDNLAQVLKNQDKLVQAEPLYREATEKRRRILGPEHPSTLVSINNLGRMLQAKGDLAEAETLLREVMGAHRRLHGPDHPSTLLTTINLAAVLVARGKHQEADNLLIPITETVRQVFTRSDPRRVASLLMSLGVSRASRAQQAADFEDARDILLEAHAIYLRARGEKHRDTRECVEAVVQLYGAWHAAEPGKGHDAKAAEWRAKMPPTESGK